VELLFYKTIEPPTNKQIEHYVRYIAGLYDIEGFWVRNICNIHCHGKDERKAELPVSGYLKKENLPKGEIEIVDVQEIL